MSAKASRRPTAAELVAIPPGEWQPADLIAAVQTAIELELSTLPPYQCGMWSIADGASSPARTLMSGVIGEEMLHMGLMCNLLAGLGGPFEIVAPTYPGPLPGGVRPDLTAYLSGLTKEYVSDVYMGIEMPEGQGHDPTIGTFYDRISEAIEALQPEFDPTNQQGEIPPIGPQEGFNNVCKIGSVADALSAIEEIKEQGEGTSTSPDAVDEGGELAHYYRFGELYNGAEYVQDSATGKWSYTGTPVPWPNVYPVVSPPKGGWPDPVPDAMTEFRKAFASLLVDIQNAFTGKGKFHSALEDMGHMADCAEEIVTTRLPDGSGNYLPDYKVS